MLENLSTDVKVGPIPPKHAIEDLSLLYIIAITFISYTMKNSYLVETYLHQSRHALRTFS